jgi:hypothetical protein
LRARFFKGERVVTVRQRIKEQDQVEAGEEMREACWRRLTCSKEIR